ncbi:hypothetical protein [Variovorax paradoxus]|uniref:hypothetical protein n=1 Tax=Variovorax paradoxus TaxID=34073 RepID=UPI0028641DBE|nr:hypothetical protein [Variovorax paradoxus]MDR6455512.1 hypothetical protein [Variovorax paradoxus]
MTGTNNTEVDIVDTTLAIEGYASLKNHGGNPVKAVQAAYNTAAKRVTASGRLPVMVRVIVHVAPQALDFESDAPLTGGACSLEGPCESCQ